MSETSTVTSAGPRLRASPLARGLEVVLVAPEIPPNTGNIGRLCAATNTPLHLVKPLGFDIGDKAVRRAGLDYWPLLKLQTHADWRSALEYFERRQDGSRRWLLSGKSRRSYTDVSFQPGDVLVFGCESQGLPQSVLDAEPDAVLAIPTLGQVRSLNLSNAVSIVLYEALRQLGTFHASRLAYREA